MGFDLCRDALGKLNLRPPVDAATHHGVDGLMVDCFDKEHLYTSTCGLLVGAGKADLGVADHQYLITTKLLDDGREMIDAKGLGGWHIE